MSMSQHCVLTGVLANWIGRLMAVICLAPVRPHLEYSVQFYPPE